MIIVLLGLPGAGKGTQGELLSSKLGIKKVSTGDILREAVRKATPLGLQAKEAMDKGELVSDDIVIGIVKEELSGKNCRKGCIMDGFPRNLQQAKELERMKIKCKAVHIKVPEEEVIKRLSSRRVCPNCGALYNLITNPPKKDEKCDICGENLIQREDDREEVIKERIKVYKESTEQLINYYRRKGKLIEINGVGSAKEVHRRLEVAL